MAVPANGSFVTFSGPANINLVAWNPVIRVVPAAIHRLFLAGTITASQYNDIICVPNFELASFMIVTSIYNSVSTITGYEGSRKINIAIEPGEYFIYAVSLAATTVLVEEYIELRDYTVL